jgi:GTP1/Obg family GTP-binding protein
MIARTIESHKKQLEEENSDLKSLMKEFFGRLQKIAENIDHEELESSVR